MLNLKTISIFVMSLIIFFTSLSPGYAQQFDVNQYVDKFKAYEISLNSGAGYSVYNSSAQLAWAESYLLNDYYMLYRVTKDTFWLDRMTQHIDQMIFNLMETAPITNFRTFSDDEIDSIERDLRTKVNFVNQSQIDPYGYPVWLTQYPGWKTDRFSAGMVKVINSKSQEANLIPNPERITDLEIARKLTGHEYKITFGDELHYGIGDLNNNTMIVKWAEFKYGQEITDIPGVSLKVEWKPRKGDTFIVKTFEPKPLQFVSHDGMILYPIARFIETVSSDNSLQGKYGKKSNVYKNLILDLFAKKWDRYWVNFNNTSGTYKYTESPAEITPNHLLPVNQNNALGRVFLLLQDKNVADDSISRDKAIKISRYFKNYLRTNGNAWVWDYWDSGDPNYHSLPEDTSHGSTDVGFADEAYHRGLIFEKPDMVRFVETLLFVMWNGSSDNPQFGDRVDSREGGSNNFHGRHWMELCEFEPRVFDICSNWFRKRGEPVNLIPTILYSQFLMSKK